MPVPIASRGFLLSACSLGSVFRLGGSGRLAVWCNRGWRGEHRSLRNPWDGGYFFGALQGPMAAFVVVLERPSSVVPFVTVSMIGYVALRILSSCIMGGHEPSWRL